MPPFPIESVADPADPRLRDYANLKDEQLRRDEALGKLGVFIAESALVVEALLRSPMRTRSILCAQAAWEGVRERLERARAAGPADAPPPVVLLVPDELLHQTVGFAFHRGVLAAGERPPAKDPLDLARAAGCMVVLEQVGNHDNVGAIFRNVAALGGPRPGVWLGPGCCDPLYRKAMRVSIGHVLSVPWAKLDDERGSENAGPARPRAWPGAIEDLDDLGFASVALTPAGEVDIADARAALSGKPVALLLGAEGPGLSGPALARASVRVRIPMASGVDSLNVATAGAVALSWLVGPGPTSEPHAPRRV